MRLTAVYRKVPQGYAAFVEELPGTNTQGETLEELEENIKDAYLLMAMDEVPEEHQMKEVAI